MLQSENSARKPERRRSPAQLLCSRACSKPAAYATITIAISATSFAHPSTPRGAQPLCDLVSQPIQFPAHSLKNSRSFSSCVSYPFPSTPPIWWPLMHEKFIAKHMGLQPCGRKTSSQFIEKAGNVDTWGDHGAYDPNGLQSWANTRVTRRPELVRCNLVDVASTGVSDRRSRIVGTSRWVEAHIAWTCAVVRRCGASMTTRS